MILWFLEEKKLGKNEKMGRRAPTKTPLPTYKPISQTVTMHVSQWGLNILIHSFFLFLKTPEYHLDGIEPRIIVFCSEDSL